MVNSFPTAEEARILTNFKIKNQEEFLKIRKLILEAATNGNSLVNYPVRLSNTNKETLQKLGYRLDELKYPILDVRRRGERQDYDYDIETIISW